MYVCVCVFVLMSDTGVACDPVVDFFSDPRVGLLWVVFGEGKASWLGH